MNIFDKILHHTKTAPVDVEAIAKDLDISIVKKQMEDDISGILTKNNDHFEITVNTNHPEKRQRFTILHGIGHWLFHQRLINNKIVDNKTFRFKECPENPDLRPFHETEANQFAASVLMPSRLIRDFKKQGITTIPELANKLNVSEQAMKLRMQSI